ncbi:hypothetical protein BDQ12DRAFT_692274 [Crucibulum laeve]|uniref:7TM GPCR serpentine receptor class x (Srx) domain-containing protein n=1 Tax=Crucibulum laeve TaxID=68775 RepID=A0A5C3LIG5_9AGAR|nr:hypothetical protein BDQ12DRAFT_692274 [Crucibulum laeve]
MASTFRLNLGAIYTGSLVNMILYTTEFFQVCIYFSSKRTKKDPQFLKACVLFSLTMDTIATISTCAWSFLYSVIYWGNIKAVQRMYWATPLMIMTGAFSGLVAQFYLVHRYWVV